MFNLLFYRLIFLLEPTSNPVSDPILDKPTPNPTTSPIPTNSKLVSEPKANIQPKPEPQAPIPVVCTVMFTRQLILTGDTVGW